MSKYAYRVISQVRKRTVCYLISEKPIEMKAMLERFRQDHGYYDTVEYFERVANIRKKLHNYRDHLRLVTDPLLDELCLVFGDWCAKESGSSFHFPEEMLTMEGDHQVIEFEFRL